MISYQVNINIFYNTLIVETERCLLENVFVMFNIISMNQEILIHLNMSDY